MKALRFLFMLALWLPGPGFAQKSLQEFTISGYAQGTSYRILYYAATEKVKKTEIDSVLQVLDQSMSLYRAQSLISRFNRSADGMPVDLHFLKVYKKARQIYKATGGRFDATVAPLVQLWGFGPQKISQFPDSASIQTALATVGMDKLRQKGCFIQKKDPRVQLDFNGIAQGYSVDVLATWLRKRPVQHFMVELGGELRVQGIKGNGQPFHIGIEGPVDKALSTPQIRHVIAFKRGAVTTSGSYQKYVQNGSRQITHLLDPKSGYPLANTMVSATVYAKDAITADGYDNALMAMTVDEALRFARQHRLEIYLIYRKSNGELADVWSAGFQKLIVN